MPATRWPSSCRQLHAQTRLITRLSTAGDPRPTRCCSRRSALASGCGRGGDLTLGAITVAHRPGAAAARACRGGSCGKSRHSSRISARSRTASETHRQAEQAGRSSRTPSRWSSPDGEIRFENVRFHYGRAAGVIEDFSLTIAPGEKVGLVGRSGAGKSTLVNLLLRFYDLEGGRILIDGQDIAARHPGIAAARRSAWSRRTPRCSTARFATTSSTAGRRRREAGDRRGGAAGACRRFHPGPRRPQGPDRLRRPCRRARRQALRRPAPAHRDRPRAPQGRADPGPRRGDQRARLGGRGGDPGVALRPHGRQDRDRHRPPPVDHRRAWTGWSCMDEGRVVEAGTHQELLRQDGLYAALWSRQSGGFLGLDERTAAE